MRDAGCGRRPARPHYQTRDRHARCFLPHSGPKPGVTRWKRAGSGAVAGESDQETAPGIRPVFLDSGPLIAHGKGRKCLLFFFPPLAHRRPHRDRATGRGVATPISHSAIPLESSRFDAVGDSASCGSNVTGTGYVEPLTQQRVEAELHRSHPSECAKTLEIPGETACGRNGGVGASADPSKRHSPCVPIRPWAGRVSRGPKWRAETRAGVSPECRDGTLLVAVGGRRA
jgi:hypothetical protein